LGVADVSTFWDPTGLTETPGGGFGLKEWLVRRQLGYAGGLAVFLGSLACYVAMTVGYRARVSVPLSFLASVAGLAWNGLPYSGSYPALQSMMFCLIWTNSGLVWSLDAWRARDEPHRGSLITPLRLLQYQVVLIYLNSGLWKLSNAQWRDGSAVHFVLNNTVYQRFRVQVSPSLDWLTTVATYAILGWEILFGALVLVPRTRRLALWGGVLAHLGMAMFIEIGPFPWVMMASYVAFLDPERVRSGMSRLAARVAKLLFRLQFG
jgi:hypothetical protein